MSLVVKNPPANAGDVRDAVSILGLGKSPGEGHSKPLQYSCLENSMDIGAWQGMVHRVAKSRTWLKQLSPHAGKNQASGIQKLKENLKKNTHTHIHTDFPCQKAWCFDWGGEGRDLQGEAVIIILLPMIEVLFRNPGVRNSLCFLHGLSTWDWSHTASSCSCRVSGEGRGSRKQGQRQRGRAKPWFNILEWYLSLWAPRSLIHTSCERGVNLHCCAHLENKYVILRKVCQGNYFLLTFFCCCSVAQLCLTLWGPMDCSTPGFPVLHYLPEFA